MNVMCKGMSAAMEGVLAALKQGPGTARQIARRANVTPDTAAEALRDLYLRQQATQERRQSFHGPGYSLLYTAA